MDKLKFKDLFWNKYLHNPTSLHFNWYIVYDNIVLES